MKNLTDEIKMFIIIFILILIIVMCLLYKYIPIAEENFSRIKYNPDSKTTLILENIKNEN